MIGISIAESNEWEEILKYFNKTHDECEKFPFGEYFLQKLIIKILLYIDVILEKLLQQHLHNI